MSFNSLNEVRASDPHIDLLYSAAEFRLQKHGLLQAACEQPEFHAPIWHEYSLMEHIEQTIFAAGIVLSIGEMIGGQTVDLRVVMALHDLAKFNDFIKYRLAGITDPRRLLYYNHDVRSAQLAQAQGFSEEVQFLIRWHALAYSGIKSERLIERCTTPERLAKLLLVFSCDAYGKGITDAQRSQRVKLARFIRQVAEQAKLPPWVAEVACETTLDGITQPA